jgi:glycosyltransferase involved in cell wall biosynthesis
MGADGLEFRQAGTARPGPHVLHVVLSLDVGGLERVVLDLLRQGHEAGQKLSVVCLERTGDLATQAKSLGAEIICLNKAPGLSLRVARELRQVLSESCPDVIHTHQLAALVYVRASLLGRHRPPVVHTEHGKHYAHRRRNRWLGRFGAGCVDRFCCVSGDVAREVQQCRVARRDVVCVVPNGVDTSHFKRQTDTSAIRAGMNIPDSAPLIGTVGRLAEIKRQDVLIRGFAQVREQLGHAHLLLVGDGPMRATLQRLANELNVGDAVHFAGYQSDPGQYLQAMNVFALTSRSEGMPLSVLEAWAAGVPVTASRVGGLPELITHGATGLLFESGNAVECSACLLQLLQDASLRQQIIAAAHDRVESEYDVKVMAGRYARSYDNLIDAAERGSRRFAPATVGQYSGTLAG